MVGTAQVILMGPMENLISGTNDENSADGAVAMRNILWLQPILLLKVCWNTKKQLAGYY